MTPDRRIRVLLADDHRIVRDGIALLIDQEADMEVAARSSTAEEAIRLFRSERPDLTVMDLQMGEIGGLEAIRAIRREDPSARIVVLTMYVGDENIYQAIEAGAAAYLYKEMIAEDLIRTIREVGNDRPVTVNILVRTRLQERASRKRLTPRELQVLELIAEGMRDKEVAGVMGISHETVHMHVKHILWKLDARDRTAAVRTAMRRGIVHMF